MITTSFLIFSDTLHLPAKFARCFMSLTFIWTFPFAFSAINYETCLYLAASRKQQIKYIWTGGLAFFSFFPPYQPLSSLTIWTFIYTHLLSLVCDHPARIFLQAIEILPQSRTSESGKCVLCIMSLVQKTLSSLTFWIPSSC